MLSPASHLIKSTKGRCGTQAYEILAGKFRTTGVYFLPTFSSLERKMTNAVQLAVWGGMLLLIGFFGIIFWKIFTGSISLDYLLYGDVRERTAKDSQSYSTQFSPGRAQALMFTVVAAGYYLLQVIQDPTKFPQIPDTLLYALGGSHAVYLGGKAQGLLLGRIRDLIDRRTP
jgi:hypothetical protein